MLVSRANSWSPYFLAPPVALLNSTSTSCCWYVNAILACTTLAIEECAILAAVNVRLKESTIPLKAPGWDIWYQVDCFHSSLTPVIAPKISSQLLAISLWVSAIFFISAPATPKASAFAIACAYCASCTSRRSLEFWSIRLLASSAAAAAAAAANGSGVVVI